MEEVAQREPGAFLGKPGGAPETSGDPGRRLGDRQPLLLLRNWCGAIRGEERWQNPNSQLLARTAWGSSFKVSKSSSSQKLLIRKACLRREAFSAPGARITGQAILSAEACPTGYLPSPSRASGGGSPQEAPTPPLPGGTAPATTPGMPQGLLACTW